MKELSCTWRCMKSGSDKKNKEKTKKHSKKRKREDTGFGNLRLLVLSQLGDVAKAVKYISKHGNSSINSFDAEGFTALHQVCPTPVALCKHSAYRHLLVPPLSSIILKRTFFHCRPVVMVTGKWQSSCSGQYHSKSLLALCRC